MNPDATDILERFTAATRCIEDLRSKMKTAHEMVEHQERNSSAIAAAAESLTRSSESHRAHSELLGALVSDLQKLVAAVFSVLNDEDRKSLSCAVSDLREATDTNSRYLYQEMQGIRGDLAKHQEATSSVIEAQRGEIESLHSRIASLETDLRESQSRESVLRGQVSTIPARTRQKHGMPI